MYTKRPNFNNFGRFFYVQKQENPCTPKTKEARFIAGLQHCSPCDARGFRNNVVQRYKIYSKSLRMDASNLRNHANIGFLYRMNKTRTATIDAAIAHVHTFERLLAFTTSLCLFSLWTVALSLVVAWCSCSVVVPFFTTFDRMAVCLMLFTPFPPLMVIFPSLSIISSGKSARALNLRKRLFP